MVDGKETLKICTEDGVSCSSRPLDDALSHGLWRSLYGGRVACSDTQRLELQLRDCMRPRSIELWMTSTFFDINGQNLLFNQDSLYR